MSRRRPSHSLKAVHPRKTNPLAPVVRTTVTISIAAILAVVIFYETLLGYARRLVISVVGATSNVAEQARGPLSYPIETLIKVA